MTRWIFTVLSLTFLLPTIGQAQEKKKDFVPKAIDVKEMEAPQRRAKKAAPKAMGERMIRNRSGRKPTVASNWNESFRLIKDLIKQTSDRDPQKPELLNRLSEMYWERASNSDLKAFDDEEVCLGKARGEAAENRCVAQRKAAVQKSQKYREDAIKVYKHIVRNFPNYERLDAVLFALAFNYQQKPNHEAAKKIYIELIKRYPRSRHVPDTLLNVGEIFFDAGQIDQALKAYRKVATNYQDSSIYGYALYKLGWCYFNKGQHADALKQFIRVIDYSNKATRGRNRLTLKREAQRDLVRSYVHIDSANPRKAIPFFRKVAPDDYMDLAEKLADLYSVTGQFAKSNELYRILITQNSKSYKVVTFQKQIAFNARAIGNQKEAVKELNRLVTLWRTVKDAKDAEPERVAKDRVGIEEQLRSMAITYHRQWLKTQSPEDYALAHNLYKDYVETFGDHKNAYDMNFFFAEFLYKRKKWKEAATHYEAALKMRPEGEYTKDAAHGTVLAYKKMLLSNRKPPPTTSMDDDGKKPTDVPKAKPLSPEHERFIVACDLYSKYVKNSQYLVDIEYDAARIYYDFNQFDKAIPRFKDISEKHKEHRLAIYAANLLLDIYNLRKDFDGMEKQADIYLKLYTRERDPQFYDLLVDIKRTSKFKTCRTVESSKEFLKAARCYVQYAQRFPQSKDVDKALYNAALNFEREKRIEQAIQIRLKLVNEVSGSDLVPKALYQIAGNLHAMAIFSKASDAYEFYAKKFPKNEEAKDALRNAAAFRQGLGQLDKAIEDYNGYMKLIGSDREKAAEVFFNLGLIYEKQERWEDVISHFKVFLKRYGKVAKTDLVLEAYTKIGNGLYKTKKRNNKNEKKALSYYKSAYVAFNKLSDTQRKGLTTGRNAVAEARFKQAEAVYREFQALKLKVYPFKNVKKFVKAMTKKISARTKLIVEARKIYLEVIEIRSPNWAIAALARIGQMFQAAANDIYNVPAPGSFDEEQKEIFKGKMTDKAVIPEGKAVEAYVLCLKKSQELRWFNEWQDLSERQLAKLKPSEYRYNAELRAKPSYFGNEVVGQDYIADIKLEESGQ